MRKLAPVGLALLALMTFTAVGGVSMQTSKRYEFTDCAAAGSAPQTVTGGEYIFRVTGEDTRICINETANPDGGTVCGFSDGGVKGEMFPTGTVMRLAIGGASSTGGSRYVSCSSSGATGDVHLTFAP